MNTVVVRLIGGLGNQLFQYAAGRAVAARSKAKLLLDASGYQFDPLRKYELNVFSIRASLAPAHLLLDLNPKKNSLMNQFRNFFRPPFPLYREKYYHYDNYFERLKSPVYIDGYWQSYRYFNAISSVLRDELNPSEPLDEQNKTVSDQIFSTNAVSIHVRRGDYVTNAHTNAYHGVCSIEYYRAAIDYVRRAAGDIHLFVFSDDQEWCKSNLRPNCPTTYVTANPPDRGYRDMQLMALCRHHIIANSSFSWWGAWLNPRPEKIVVAPRNWFANSEHDTRDLIPETWVRL